jgi:hypothetical protein
LCLSKKNYFFSIWGSHHIYVSKNLIGPWVRHYLTSIADHEIKKIEQGSYLSRGIISTNGETNLIQEGADNVDINTETIDGKDTFHSMARTVFLVQTSSDRPTVGPIKCSSDRSLHITEASSNIIACLPFKKPKERIEPVRCADAYAQILSCQVNNTET